MAKPTDKMYVVVRSDLDFGSQLAQALHGARLFAAEHAQIEHDWYNGSNTIVVLKATDESHLQDLSDKATVSNIQWSMFREPDLHNQATCLVLAPGHKTRRICQNLQLAG